MGQGRGFGVDFGSATTLIAEHVSWGPASILPLGHATTWLPSVARAVGTQIVVGEEADHAGPAQIRSIKRAITERRETVVVAGPDGPREVDADTVIAEILRELVRRARRAGAALGPGNEVRLGCPAMWDGAQRGRLIRIAIAAGLPAMATGLVDEPVAAGLAWLSNRYLAHGERPTGTLLVFDMGGGTLDVAVLSVAGGPSPRVAVLASLGVALAGDALDVAIGRDLAAEMAANRIDIAHHPQPELAWGLLERAGRETKIRLTGVDEHPVVLPRQLGYAKSVAYRRDRLESAFRTQMDGAETLVLSALRAARMTRDRHVNRRPRTLDRADLVADVDFVLLAGGMSRIPYVARRLRALFGQVSIHDNAGVAPEETVVAGLADTVGYERITLNRPGFHLILEWSDARERQCLYEAYTPLFEPWQVYSGDTDACYERRLPPGAVPPSGQAWLRAVSLAGADIGLSLDGVECAGLPVPFGPAAVALRVFSDGTMELADGRGGLTTVRAEAWPVIRGSGDTIVLRRVDRDARGAV